MKGVRKVGKEKKGLHIFTVCIFSILEPLAYYYGSSILTDQ